jgi:hypothetical protein
MRRGLRGKQKEIVRVLYKCYQGVFMILYKGRSLYKHVPSKLMQQTASAPPRTFCDVLENDDEAKPWVPTRTAHNNDDDNTVQQRCRNNDDDDNISHDDDNNDSDEDWGSSPVFL